MKVVYSLIIVLGLLLSGCADAGKDKSVESGATVILDGSGSVPDTFGEIKRYKWKQIEGKKVVLSDKKSVKPSFTAPIVTKEKTLVFKLTTIEKGGYVSPWRTSDTVSITVTPSSSFNTPPTASAEVNLTTIKYGESVTFSAAGSIDSDGEIISYEWIDENNVTLSAESEFVYTFATAGVHVITLIVTDDGGKGATESVSVTVHELQKPIAVINSSTDTVLIDGNVTFDANGSNDVDGEIVSYRWLDDTNAVLSHEKSFTHTFSTKGEHNITLIVTDDDGQEGVAKASIMAEALLLSISLEADITSLEVNETATLTATGHYNDNTTEDVSSNVEWIIDDNTKVSIDSNGILTALKSGSTTIMAKIGDVESNMISMEINEPVLLESLSISPSPIEIRVGQSTQIVVEGYYNDGSRKVIEEGLNYTITNQDLITLDSSGTIEGLQEGSTTFTANVGTIVSSIVNVNIGRELNTSNFNFTNFGNTYINQIPSNSTKESYDENRFCMIAGAIYAEDGSPLSGVAVSIHKHPEYGTVTTNSEGIYTIPAEGGVQLTMRYQKQGYTTIDRKIQAPVQDWVRTEDVTILQKDSKVTTINLADSAPQTHISTPVNDDRGTRSTTLVFDGVTKATVTSPNGTTRELTNIDVRATEFKTPESMPADLPKESAFTYCSELEIDGVKDDEEVNFDAPVVMYVENFLGFDVGEIVPVGYYDRNQGKWIGSDNGAVVQLLDMDNDGQIDALDSTGDGQPNDLDGDGSLNDEVAGIQNDPNYVAGNTYWRAEFTHFTPWDHNWPYGPPLDADAPDLDDPQTDEDEPNDCQVDVSSYVTNKSRVFHEDIPIAGTDITLHYSTKRVDGYKYVFNASVDTSNMPSSVMDVTATLSVAGKTYVKKPDINELKNLEFVWDSEDILGNRVSGNISVEIKVAYKYIPVYYQASDEFAKAWAKAGKSSTNIIGREFIEYVSRKTSTLTIEPAVDNNNVSLGNGWSLSNHHKASGDVIFKGDGTKVSQSAFSNFIVNYFNRSYHNNVDDLQVDKNNNVYVVSSARVHQGGTYGKVEKIDSEGNKEIIYETNTAILDIALDQQNNVYVTDCINNRISKIDPSGTITNIAGNGLNGFSEDGSLASDASLTCPLDPNIDTDGNLFYREAKRIRKIDSDGVITTVVGNGLDGYTGDGYSGDGNLAINTSFDLMGGYTLDHEGNIFIIDDIHIRKVDVFGRISTIAGNGIEGFSGDGGLATDASLKRIHDLEIDDKGNIYVISNSRVRMINSSGVINTIVGGSSSGKSFEDGIETLQIGYVSSTRIALDKTGNYYLNTYYNIWKISPDDILKKHNINEREYLYRNKNNIAYIFDFENKHSRTVDFNTRNILEQYSYDESGLLIAINDTFGETTTITRGSEGFPTLITAPNGQKTYLTVDEQRNLTEIRYENSSSYNFTYFDGSLMDIMTDPNGNQIQHIFDENGRIIEETDGENGSFQFLRDVTYTGISYSTVKPMGETQTSKDIKLENGDTQSLITLPSGETMTATFSNEEKRVESLRDGVNSITIYTVDSFTHQKIPVSQDIIQPSGLTKSIIYNTSYDGNATHTNSKIQTTTNNGKATTIHTDYNNGMEIITSPEGRTVTREYDIDTRLTSSLISGTLTPTTFTYDSKGRVTTEATGTRETTYTYDARGNVESITDPRGKVTTFTYDVMDRVTGVSYPDGTTEAFSYDNNGNLLARTVPTPADHTFTYNGVDKRTGYISPLHKATTYTYNKSKQVTQIERPSGKTITNTYDKGRLVSTTTPEGTTEYSYLFADKVGSITHGSESFSFTYDGTLLTGITQNGLVNHTINYTYNNDFKVTSSTYAGVTENYSYDNDGLLTGSGDYTLTRDTQNGYVTQLTDGTLTQNRSYNSYGEITEVSDNIFTYQLTNRDNAGAITQKSETLNGTTATYNYTYDDMGRLVEVKKDGTVTEEYSYDNNGNRLSATVNGETTTASYTLDDQLEVYGDNTYRYDEDGYLTEKTTPDGTTTYDYGTMGEIKEVVTSIQTITYQHNALNQRVAKLINGQVVEKYLWADLTTLLAVYDANDNLVQRFEYAAPQGHFLASSRHQRMPVSMSSNGMKYYLHYDQVGSLRAVSDTSGQIVKEIVYDTFGTIVSDSNPSFKVPFGFAGGLYDRDTGLTRFGYRDFDTYTGKWTAKDPIGFEGGDSNLYGYVLGDPVNFVDPKGLSKIFSMAEDTGKIKATIEGSLSIEKKFNRCMTRAKRVCPPDFAAQQVCGACRAKAEDRCRFDLFRDVGKNIVTPWFL